MHLCRSKNNKETHKKINFTAVITAYACIREVLDFNRPYSFWIPAYAGMMGFESAEA